eukprot:TRINITY_DN12299_c0_g1_i1.p1 TRINITY_DN12299_c0_g1~~TRINITY_DN12299_c0_g1_i1.p1  ORF type:complete len:313 (+),score=65.14 TRINITY_DN12299_c0_g1_i1:32-940(+)
MEEAHVKRYADKDIFLQDVGQFLYASEVENNMIIGFLSSFENHQMILLAVLDSKQVVNCGMLTILNGVDLSHRLLLAYTSTESNSLGIKLIFNYIVDHNILEHLRDITGFERDALYFSQLWKEKLFKGTEIKMIESSIRLYKLHTINQNTLQNLKGRMVLGTLSDVDIAIDFHMYFQEAIHEPLSSREQTKEYVTSLINKQLLYFYEVFNEEQSKYIKVSMAVNRRESSQVGCISTVATPVKFQNNGYGTQLVALLCKTILEEKKKKYAALFADSQNPHSTYIYQKIGFLPVGDWLSCRISQ